MKQSMSAVASFWNWEVYRNNVEEHMRICLIRRSNKNAYHTSPTKSTHQETMKHPLRGWDPPHGALCLFQNPSMPWRTVGLGMKNLSLCQRTCHKSLPWTCHVTIVISKYGKKLSTNLTQFIPQKIGGWSLLNCASCYQSWYAKKFYELPFLMLKLYSFSCYSFLTAMVWNGEVWQEHHVLNLMLVVRTSW
jgi:hypothetical protein